VTTLQGFTSCCGPASCHPLNGVSSLRFDAGISPGAGSQLPRTLTSPRTGLAPAGCREFVARLRHVIGSLLPSLPWRPSCWAHQESWIPTADRQRVRAGMKAGASLESARSSIAMLRAAAQSSPDSTAAGSPPPTSPAAPPAVETKAAAADIDVVGWAAAACSCFQGFAQVKANVRIKNTGSISLPIGAGEGSSWRLLVRTPTRGPFSTPPRTPIPLQYGVIDLGTGPLVRLCNELPATNRSARS